MRTMVTTLGWAAVTSVWAAAGDSPFAKPTAPRGDAGRGILTRSDGKVYGGAIYTTRGRRLNIYDTESKRWMKLRVMDIRTMVVTVRKQEVVKEWKFREGGHDDKMFTGRVKLDRYYDLTVQYVQRGRERTLKGHIKGAPLYVDHWDGTRYRFFIKQHHSGEWTTKEKVENSLTYTTRVDLTKDPAVVKKRMETKEEKK